ncbi:RsmB/NOP family class I SAM-dependent RNA methyltransferase [Acidianus sp. HS-5]|uniref:RsmB/NOP family class I SAM-dependent RNA methyltransferase n=1 Tax=Acidianus sp. HS-5 TaxID=2886040 RepID=UPI001F3DC489|nr:RsmB/NOP family class I SAM-dependent RNA methyltransferase [Acidianus sp. HS-5]
MNQLEKVYGKDLNGFLESVKKPNSRLYVRVNTLKATVDEVLQSLQEFEKDEDFPEAIYAKVRGPNKLESLESKVIVDKKTAESVMLGANVYPPGIKKIISEGKSVEVVSENGITVANGELVRLPGGKFMVKVYNSLYSSPKLADMKELKEGKIYVQGKASMYVARIVDPQPGEFIVDMTAAPGGKLSHIYQLEPRAKIIGFDHTYKKVDKMKHLLKKMNVDAQVFVHDSRYLKELGIKDVDKVLIDPPCSALGLRPKVYDKKTRIDLMNLQAYQKQFLNSAYEILKKGGKVIYSTCTVTETENEEVINDPRFEIEYIIRFHPQVHDMTGFFIAKLRKK